MASEGLYTGTITSGYTYAIDATGGAPCCTMSNGTFLKLDPTTMTVFGDILAIDGAVQNGIHYDVVHDWFILSTGSSLTLVDYNTLLEVDKLLSAAWGGSMCLYPCQIGDYIYFATNSSPCKVFRIEQGTPSPVITSITPPSGDKGTTLAISLIGTDLSTVNSIDFGAGISVDAFVIVSALEITITVTIDPFTSVGLRDVSVTAPEGTDTLVDGFEITESTGAHYQVHFASLNIPYEDMEESNNLHLTLKNLSGDAKLEGGDGEVVIEISYELAG
jgi:hypothetical protein